ncbi:MAG: PAS domain S-box protein, partial [Anaerolineaceae bacterium]|nr:PAS domain S-box protein [Anaerolineaceae bacterium]
VLFYALAVLLSGMLLDYPMGIVALIISCACYSFFGIRVDGFSVDTFPKLITFLFGLIGIALLQHYTYIRLQHLIADQVRGYDVLKAEIYRREQAEFANQVKETQLSRLADNITDMVTEIDPQGTMRYVSPSYKTGLGYNPDDLLGTNAFDLIHPEDRQTAQEVAQIVAASHLPGRLEIKCCHANGHLVDVEISGNPLYTEQGEFTGFILASRDITLQKRAEAITQESERKFRNIIESLPMGIHMYAVQEDRQLIFVGYNPAAEAILGIDHSQLLEKTIEDAFPGLVGTEIPEAYIKIALAGGQWKKEQVDYSQDTIQGAFEVNAFQTSPGQMVAVFADITERILASEELRLSEEKFATAFITSPDSVNINRLADGIYIDINQGFTSLMGYSREEIIGKSSLELNIWADPSDRGFLVKSLREHGVVENLEARFRRKNGEIGIGLMSARVIRVQDEICILSITRDITRRIQSEIELRETHTRLEQAYEATLQGWARALELRERETANHSRRVVENSLKIAQALGIEGEDLVHIQRGALLHDIGKMGIPDEILLKPGPLTADEWMIMRRHTDNARAMLIDIDYLRPSIVIPYGHHEKWDGSGYPQGLKGEDIPLPARIFAVVDVFDALSHDRPYRPAWSLEDTRRYLIEQSGIHFDPEIVRLFLSL